MPYISEESILEVQRAVDIYEIVSGYFPLKRSGSHYKALCPFHDEKTPSFIVSPHKQMYKCFGCQKGGGVFRFVMDLEKLEFPEAVKMLADRAGIALRYTGGGQGPGIDRGELYRINEWAAGYFRRLLLSSPEAERAREYVANRKVEAPISETFNLGYAIESWDGLTKAARNAGFGEQTLLGAGLVLRREESGTVYDRFRGRLMFPIKDPQGRSIGFGARALGNEEVKYINTPETAVFSKGRNFYGLDLVRDEVEKEKRVCIVEGYFDVILPYQDGFRNIIATLGTALTRAHIDHLKRYVDKVILIYDADNAGRKASERSMDMLIGEDIDIFVARLPKGFDPCDCVAKGKADALREAVVHPMEIFDFLVESIGAKIDATTTAGKARAAEEVLARIAAVPNPVKRDVLLQRLAVLFGIDEKALRAQMRAPEDRGPAPSMGALKTESDPMAVVGREIVELMLESNDLIPEVRKTLPLEDFPSLESRRAAEKIYELFERYGAVQRQEIVNILTQDAPAISSWLSGAEGEPTDKPLAKRLEGCLKALTRRNREKKIRDLNVQLAEAEREGRRERVNDILREKQAIWKN